MSSDSSIQELPEPVLLRLEYPFSVPLWLPIPARNPFVPFIGVPPPGLAPRHLPDVIIQFPEYLCGNIMAVVVCPPLSDRV